MSEATCIEHERLNCRVCHPSGIPKQSVTDEKVARVVVRNLPTADAAAQYLYKCVGWQAIARLARTVGCRVTNNSQLSQAWCYRLACNLRGEVDG